MDRQDIFKVVDTLAKEYSWTIDYILRLPMDIIRGLVRTIAERTLEERAINTKLMGLAVNCGFNGKLDKLDKLFKPKATEEVSPEEQKRQMKSLWSKLGKDLNEFEKQYKKGNVRF